MQRPLPAEAENAARDEKANGAAAPNEDILVWVGAGLVPRNMAKVCRTGGGRIFGLCLTSAGVEVEGAWGRALLNFELCYRR